MLQARRRPVICQTRTNDHGVLLCSNFDPRSEHMHEIYVPVDVLHTRTRGHGRAHLCGCLILCEWR
jgi:hypothetical protein